MLSVLMHGGGFRGQLHRFRSIASSSTCRIQAMSSGKAWETASKGSTLVIVESPTKAKTIQDFLNNGEGLDGADYIVDFCAGHIRDLPMKAKDAPAELKKKVVVADLKLNVADLGVDVDNDFTPIYVQMAGKNDVVERLKGLSKKCSRILLATDEDREGEAISWHLLETLRPAVPVKRAVFHEITESAIKEAFLAPRDIDMDLVRSQETRRILDRLAGYTISPILWRYVSPGLSAGRVQSCGLDIISERERARWAFVPSKYYSVEASMAPAVLGGGDGGAGSDALEARVIGVDGTRVATNSDFDGETGKLKLLKGGVASNKLILDKSKTEQLVQWLSGFHGDAPALAIVDKSHKKMTKKAPSPFITSTLQQEGSRALRLSPARTMAVAQQLYEEGFITYMRTDSPLLSAVARQAATAHVTEIFGERYVAGAQGPVRTGRKKDAPKNAQEAHEAIRPADKEGKGRFTPPYATGLSGEKLALYRLIYKRTLASVMAGSESLTTTYSILASGSRGSGDTHYPHEVELRASGTRVTFPGFLAALRMPLDKFYDDIPFVQTSDGILDLDEGQVMTLLSEPMSTLEIAPEHVVEGDDHGDDEEEESTDEAEGESNATPAAKTGLRALEHITRAPARYSESSFIKELETVGVGRPSTYAKILQILRDREYIRVESRTVVPTVTGMVVSALMRRHFPELVEPSFTAEMEDNLDAIAAGKVNKEAFLRGFYIGADGRTGDCTGIGLRNAVETKLSMNEIDHKESRSLAIPALDGIGTISYSRSGAFVEQEVPDGDKPLKWKLPESMQLDIRAITPTAIKELMETGLTTEGAIVGVHPESKRPVSIRSGRFGKYVLVGEDADKDKQTFSVPEALDVGLSLEQVLEYTCLPREVGIHPQLNLPMVVDVSNKALSVGVKGYPVRINLPEGMHPFDVTESFAAELLVDGQAILDSMRPLGEWIRSSEGEDGVPREVSIRRGRFGPYIRAGNIIAGLRKLDPAEVTLEMAIEILETRGKEAGSGRRRKRKTKAKAKAKGTATTTKKKKAKAAPRVPRAKSAYQLFVSDAMTGVLVEDGMMGVKLSMGDAAGRWKAMSHEEKAPFEERALQGKATAAAAKAGPNSRKTAGRSKASDVRRARTGYQVYVGDALKGLLPNGPSPNQKMSMADAAAAWRGLSDAEKELYAARGRGEAAQA